MQEPDFLERLAELEVPPPPPQLDREVHQRVNRLLLATQLADLATRGLWFAFSQFFRPFVHLAIFTVTRKLPPATRPTEGGSEPPRGGE